MRKLYIALGLTLLLLGMTACVAEKSAPKTEVISKTALIEQLEEGKELNTANCTKCHNTSVYTREDRKVQSLDVLTKRVKGCNTKTGAGLNDEELETLTLFLNTEYYKFEK